MTNTMRAGKKVTLPPAPAKVSAPPARASAPPPPKASAPPKIAKTPVDTSDTAELTQSQLDGLRHQLLELRASIIAKVESHFMLAESHETVLPDELDQAARDQDRGMLLLLAEKERGLINEIDAALLRFDDGTYGQCEGTSEPIGYKRLQARPWARYSVAFKEMLEREERGYNRG